ncbi:MAG TPA: molybdopterin cofactor-binding domain-containing protein, partial [Candidatus Acidoferrales bacterium]
GPGAAPRIPQEINAWLHVGENDVVTIFTGKVEIGQNAHTSLSQLVADELHVPLAKVEIVMADTARTPFDRGTLGSETTAIMGTQLRRAASAARALIVEQAATQWKVDGKNLVASAGRVSDPQNHHSASYGELLKGQELTQVIPADDPPAPPSQWTIAGTSITKMNGREFVTGAHRFTSDMKLPDMLHGHVVRPSAFGATLDTVDTSAAEAMPGVVVVHDGDFIGVAAPSRALAERAGAAIKATWKETPQPSNVEIFDYLKAHSKPSPNRGGDRTGGDSDVLNAGSMEQGLAAADQKLSQTYTVRYIAHCPLEPRVALAQWDGDQVTVWATGQRPFGVRTEVARAFRIPEEKVRIIAPESSPAYGGKHTGEASVEAARLARAAKKPVKLFWTRAEEFQWAYFRPAGVMEVQSGVRNDGTLTAWEFHNYNSGNAALGSPYRIPNKHHEFHTSDTPLRQGSYRGLAATANHFARESHMDELAHLVKIDPLEFRRKNLNDARLLAVFDAAAKAFGWGAAKTVDGQGFGMGGGTEKGGYVATFAEVRVNRATGAVHVQRVVTAYECGAIVNPECLSNQIEGAMMYGLGGALFEQIDFANGRVRNDHFAQYRLPRFSDMPDIQVVLVPRKDLEPAGAGETPMFGLAPAIGNAIFDATGVRLRALPLVPQGLKA